MKNLKTITGVMLWAAFSSCSSGPAGTDNSKTPEARFLQTKLEKVPGYGFMVGHHDDPVYGIGWDGDENRSDIKSVCGDYPAVMSFDLGRIELGGDRNLDKVPFERIRKETVAQYERGGVVSFSWHADNPVTGKDTWDVSDSTVVKSVLPGGVNHEKFLGWLDKVADFFNSIQTSEGVKVPVLFRPWHEHTGSWFWWGEKLCTADEYKTLWRMTVDSLRVHAWTMHSMPIRRGRNRRTPPNTWPAIRATTSSTSSALIPTNLTSKLSSTGWIVCWASSRPSARPTTKCLP